MTPLADILREALLIRQKPGRESDLVIGSCIWQQPGTAGLPSGVICENRKSPDGIQSKLNSIRAYSWSARA